METDNPQYNSEGGGAVYDSERNNAIYGHTRTVRIDVAEDQEEQRAQVHRRRSTRRDGADLTTAVWSLGGPISLTLFSSVIQSAAAIQVCTYVDCIDYYAYSVAAGLVSAILLFVYLVLFTFARDSLPERGVMFLSIFLFVWWLAACGVLTFGTSAIVGTSYFAIWSSFLFSGFIMHTEVTQFQAVVNRVANMANEGKATFYLLLASLVEVISAGVACGQGICASVEIYALVVGGLSVILCVLLLKVDGEKFHGMEKSVSVFLCFWWAVGMGVLTILGPFQYVGNGFFSTWLAFFSAFFVAEHHLFPRF